MSRFSNLPSFVRVAVAALALAIGVAGCASAERATLEDAPADSGTTEQDATETEETSESESTDETDESAEAAEAAEAEDTEEEADPSEQRFPNVIEVNFTREGSGPYSFDVTISSPYDTPERYADAWRVVGPDGTVYGTRELTHDHQAEQPFTRSLNGIVIPEGATDVIVEARDSVNGWGGGTVDIRLDPAA